MVVPLDAALVKGSHGCRPANMADWPVLITERRDLLSAHPLDSTAAYDIIKHHVVPA